MKILLAYDGGEPARHALDRAVELAKATGSTIDVVSVVPERDGHSPSRSLAIARYMPASSRRRRRCSTRKA